jgi:hypothetical protein
MNQTPVNPYAILAISTFTIFVFYAVLWTAWKLFKFISRSKFKKFTTDVLMDAKHGRCYAIFIMVEEKEIEKFRNENKNRKCHIYADVMIDVNGKQYGYTLEEFKEMLKINSN